MAIRAFNDLNKRQQLAVLIGVPAAVAMLFIVLTYRALGVLGPDERLPGMLQRHEPGNLWDQIADLNTQIKTQEAEIAKEPAIRKQLADYEADIKAARERLPLESEKAEMRLLIEKLARDIPSDIGNVQVQSVRIIEDGAGAGPGRDRSGGDDTHKVIYQTEITGDLNGIIKYIDMIEKNARFMLVNNISLKPGEVRLDAEKKLTFAPHVVKMSLVTYVYNPLSGKGR
jgi:hypothetical protein